MFANIVFMQDEEGREVVDRLERVEGVVAHGPTDETVADAIVYLAQWDYGTESEHDLVEKTGEGTQDKVTEVDGYVLTWNLGLGYVGLYRRMEA